MRDTTKFGCVGEGAAMMEVTKVWLDFFLVLESKNFEKSKVGVVCSFVWPSQIRNSGENRSKSRNGQQLIELNT